MKAEIVTIGDEILIGQIINTNSVWIAQQLNLIGVTVAHMSSVADDKQAILKALDDASMRADFVFITGGLGPTKDDITKKTFSDYFSAPLIINAEVLADVTSFVEKRNRPLTDINKKQAEVPEGCIVIRNKNGTAPGMWMEKNGKMYVSMPGVPYEMKGMMTDSILPRITSTYQLPFIYHKTILTQGIGESVLAEKIEAWEDHLATNNIKLAYLPSPGMVRLRLSASGNDKVKLITLIEDEVKTLQPLIADYIYGYEEYGNEPPSMAEIVGNLLREKRLKLALAESCTGGYISHLITSIAGSSDYFNGCIVPYHNEFKHQLLQVDNTIFQTHGAVSEECVVQMAKHTLQVFNADVAIAVSGIAGPSGGSSDKPVGTVWIAVGNKEKIVPIKCQYGDDRQRNIQMTAITALNLLRKFVLNEEVKL